MSTNQVEALFQAMDLLVGRIVYLMSIGHINEKIIPPVVFDIGGAMSVEIVSVPFNADGKEVENS